MYQYKIPQNQGQYGTCYAYAIAGIIQDTQKRIHRHFPMKKPEDFQVLLNMAITKGGLYGANTIKVLS